MQREGRRPQMNARTVALTYVEDGDCYLIIISSFNSISQSEISQ